MARVAADENLHMVFYRDMLAAAIQLDPSAFVRAVADEILNFQMPGAGIHGFKRKAALIAKAGIYNIRIHRDEVVLPILKYWKFFELTDLDETAERARDHLRVHLEELDVSARRLEAHLARSAPSRGEARS